jgi:hypothetical protein
MMNSEINTSSSSRPEAVRIYRPLRSSPVATATKLRARRNSRKTTGPAIFPAPSRSWRLRGKDSFPTRESWLFSPHPSRGDSRLVYFALTTALLPRASAGVPRLRDLRMREEMKNGELRTRTPSPDPSFVAGVADAGHIVPRGGEEISTTDYTHAHGWEMFGVPRLRGLRTGAEMANGELRNKCIQNPPAEGRPRSLFTIHYSPFAYWCISASIEFAPGGGSDVRVSP